jgi:C4-dicarboxylate-specific signal transduction histidine kinase
VTEPSRCSAIHARSCSVITRLRSLLRKEDPHHQPIDMNEVTQEVLALMRSDLPAAVLF